MTGPEAIAAEYEALPILVASEIARWKAMSYLFRQQAVALRCAFDIEVLDVDPYESADEMFQDIKAGRFKVTNLNSQHPVWSITDNVNFRIAHDLLGHGQAGSDFSFDGEVAAFESQRLTVPAQLRGALFTEVVGQAAFACVHHYYGEQKVGLLSEALIPA